MGPLAESLHCVGKTKPDSKQNNVEKIEAKDTNVEDINVEIVFKNRTSFRWKSQTRRYLFNWIESNKKWEQ